MELDNEVTAFDIPNWIKKGALTKGMFEPIDYKFINEHRKAVQEDASSMLHTLTEYIYDKHIEKLSKELYDSHMSYIDTIEIEEKLNKLENEKYFVESVYSKYKKLTGARFDYSSRYHEDLTDSLGTKLDGGHRKFLDHVVIIKKGKSKYFETPSLFWYALEIQIAKTNDMDIKDMKNYKSFLVVADQIFALHAVCYYASQIEEAHKQTITHLNNKMDLTNQERDSLISAEDFVYNQKIKEIDYSWAVMRPLLLEAIENSKPLKLNINETGVIEENINTDLENFYSYNAELYSLATNKIKEIKDEIRQKSRQLAVEK